MTRRILIVSMAAALLAGACSSGDQAITVYSGRSEELVGPLIERFTEDTGIEVSVRYAGSAELAATIREEGSNSPADVFFAQDPASLGTVALEGLFTQLPSEVTDRVDDMFSDNQGRWVGTSGRVRVMVYDPAQVTADELPGTVADLTGAEWDGRLGIAPTNGSFLAFVAAMILTDGEDATKAWLEGVAANSPQTFSGNSVIVAAVDDGDVDAGLVNHYYLIRRIDELGAANAVNHFFLEATPGGLVMPAGVGVLNTSDNEDAALEFVRYLLSADAQTYFAEETFEYPLIEGIPANASLPPLASLNPPAVDLSALATVLDRATDLVAGAGLL